MLIMMEVSMTQLKNSDRATNAGLGSRNLTDPAAVDVEQEPVPARTPDTESDRNNPPQVRMGRASEAPQKPTEGDPDHDNPVHHTGHMPPPVTSNRD